MIVPRGGAEDGVFAWLRIMAVSGVKSTSPYRSVKSWTEMRLWRR